MSYLSKWKLVSVFNLPQARVHMLDFESDLICTIAPQQCVGPKARATAQMAPRLALVGHSTARESNQEKISID